MYEAVFPISLLKPYSEYFYWSSHQFDTYSEAVAFAKQNLHLSLLEYVIVSYQDETLDVIKNGYRASALYT